MGIIDRLPHVTLLNALDANPVARAERLRLARMRVPLRKRWESRIVWLLLVSSAAFSAASLISEVNPLIGAIASALAVTPRVVVRSSMIWAISSTFY